MHKTLEPASKATSGPMGTRLSRILSTMLLASAWLIPIDFVQAGSTARILYATSLGTASAMFLFGRTTPGRVRAAFLLVLLFLITVSVIASSSLSTPTFAMIAKVLAGAGVVALVGVRYRAMLWIFALVIVVSLFADRVVGRLVSSEMFGAPIFAVDDSNGLRPRGLLGSAVPAGLLVAAACGALLFEYWGRGKRLAGAAALSVGMIGILLSGTRSGLVVLSAAVIFSLLRALATRTVNTRMIVTGLGFGGVATGVFLMLFEGSPLARRSDLLSSDSFLVRSSALDVLGQLPQECDVCVLGGHGHGALRNELYLGYSVNGVGTLDNQFVSFYWDYGAVGVLLLAVLIVYAFINMLRSEDEARASLGCLTVLVFLCGFFYDVLYVSVGAQLIGFGLLFIARKRFREQADV